MTTITGKIQEIQCVYRQYDLEGSQDSSVVGLFYFFLLLRLDFDDLLSLTDRALFFAGGA
jgi:hypothetical protein